MNTLPLYIPVTFGLTVLLVFYLLLNTLRQTSPPARVTLIGVFVLLWLSIQTGLSLNGFYQVRSVPPRIVFLAGPTLLVIGFLFAWGRSRAYLQTLSLERLSWIHVVRIPVELVLFWLFLYRRIPIEMTFEGRNFDILAGLTAPFVAYFGIRQGKLSRPLLLVWNLLCVGLLLNIIVTSVLSSPLPIQRFGFNQPNIAMGQFPFVLLPGFIVPVVLWSHLTALYQLIWVRRSVSSAQF